MTWNPIRPTGAEAAAMLASIPRDELPVFVDTLRHVGARHPATRRQLAVIVEMGEALIAGSHPGDLIAEFDVLASAVSGDYIAATAADMTADAAEALELSRGEQLCR